MMKKVVLWPNTRRDGNLKVTRLVAERLIDMGVSVIIPNTVCESAHEGILLHEPTAAFENADAVITLGGDGTILKCAGMAAEYNVPVLGINLGRLGFMAELEVDELELLDKAVSGEYTLDTRMMLDVSIITNGIVRHTDHALNDAVVSGGATARVVELLVAASGERLMSFLGDGVIVSTPTGSTAYAMSAGGPIVEPNIENMTVTPICPHELYARSFILSGEREVCITPFHAKGHSAFLTVDGRNAVFINANEYILITRSSLVTRLIRLKERNFYKIISEKLGRV